jgi:hypothetical protein
MLVVKNIVLIKINRRYGGFILTKKNLKIMVFFSLGPICLLESSVLLESEFRESELFSDVW